MFPGKATMGRAYALAFILLTFAMSQQAFGQAKPFSADEILPDLPTAPTMIGDMRPEPVIPDSKLIAESVLVEMDRPRSASIGHLFSDSHPSNPNIKYTCCDQACDYLPSGLVSHPEVRASGYPPSGVQNQAGVQAVLSSADPLPNVRSAAYFQGGATGEQKLDQAPSQNRLMIQQTRPQPFVEEYSAAYAGSLPDRYVSLFGGMTVANDFDDSFMNAAVLTNTRGTFRDGWAVGAAIGRWIRPRTRFESEFTFRTNSGNRLVTMAGGGTVGTTMTGQTNAYSGMANLIMDQGQGDIRTYVGAGAGFCFVDADLAVGATQFLADESAFAYQGILGLAIKTSSFSEFFTEYRYFGTDDVTLANSTSGRTTPFRFTSHNIFFGLRLYR